MTRSILTAILLLSGCVGQIEGVGGPSTGTGDTTSDGTDAGAGTASTPDGGAAVACDPAVTTSRTGEHRPGEACLDCHRTGGEGPRFTLGGTLFTGLTSTTPIVGATVHVVDSVGTDVALVTAANGNFWTTQTLTFPVTVRASRCPQTKPMVSPVTETGGNCNMAGCHTASFRIYVP